ncbi:carboxypeptidase-like regulatory domain-containing protein [Bizionia gelidisalsuginis]|nr:carboxypeptidase-like regulatory domain-containing protein [Bizionia gelidisalsuginis]
MIVTNIKDVMMKHLKTLVFLPLLLLVFTTCSEEQIDGDRIGTINGKVVAKGTNAPLENVKVSTNPVSSTVFTDEEGNFMIENAVVNTYAVQAELAGYVTAFESVAVLENTVAVVAFELALSNANNQPPSVPVLVFPEDLQTDVPFEVQFTWESSDPDTDDDLSYILELRNGATNNIELYETAQDTFYLASNLDLATTYFWQVKVNDGVNDDVVSQISQFTTIALPNNPYFFVKREEGNSVIYSGNEDGLNGNESEADISVLKLTSAANNSFRPRSNPVINKVAYLRNVGGNTQIFTMDTGGGNKTQITSVIPVNGFRIDEADFCWAQNGSQLYYPNLDKLYRVNADGSGTVLMYQTTDGSFITEVEEAAFDTDLLLIKTNDYSGYNARIFTYRLSLNTEETIVTQGVPGALGGIDITANGQRVVYTRDVSGSENLNYRIFESRMFVFDIPSMVGAQLSTDAALGENDLDVKYAPNEGAVIFTRVGNNIGAIPSVFKLQFDTTIEEKQLFSAGSMPDWK